MPALEYFLVSESISVDQDTNSLSLFGILEGLSGPLPISVDKLVATSCWNMSEGEQDKDFQVALRITLDGEILPESEELNVNFTTSRPRHRIFHFLRGLALPTAGSLVFEVLLNGEPKATHTVTIRNENEGS